MQAVSWVWRNNHGWVREVQDEISVKLLLVPDKPTGSGGILRIGTPLETQTTTPDRARIPSSACVRDESAIP